ncbi:MAG: ABC transporter ATP-binding protein [Lachnospiraceae bacterium]|nr:ABC transporter ATP-binding protein [Lachnospiraceae bacterium]
MLEIRDLSVAFIDGHSVQAVEHVSLLAEDGEHVAIVGETGSGKSILLLAILGLLQEGARVTGEILFEGQDLLKLSKKAWNKVRGSRISYVPQGNGNGLNPLLKIGFQISEPMMIHKNLPRGQAWKKGIELMKRFYIGNEEQAARQYPHTFSGGMKQRALIAMGIAADAGTLLADEPTKGLDEERIQEVVKCFQDLDDRTILCVTHDIGFAREISRKLCVMYASYLVEYGPTAEVLARPFHPYTRDILSALPENGLKFTAGFSISHEDYGETGCKYARRCRDCFEKCQEMPPAFETAGRKVRCWKYAP